MAIGPDKHFYIADADSSSVKRFDGATGAFLDTFVSSGSGGLNSAQDVVFGPDGNLYVGSYETSSVLRYDGTTGTFLSVFVSSGSGGLSDMRGITFTSLAEDADGDGVLNDEDECPNSALSATVVIDSCDSEVTNTVFPSGCTLADLLADCADNARKHRKFVHCVAKLTNTMKRIGIITGQQKGAIQRCAAQADLP